MHVGLSISLLLFCGMLALVRLVHAQAVPAAEPRALDLREDVLRLPVTVRNLYGRSQTRRIPLTVYRPEGEGPFPLVIMNHGRAATDRRALQGRQRYEVLARYLVTKGFTVFVPTRLGYGDTYGDFDPEEVGGCVTMRLPPMAQAATDQVLATLAYAQTLPWVDTSRWVAMGQSVGGLAVVAAAARRPPGLAAAVNFSGGIGGDPERRPGNPCSPDAVERLFGISASSTEVPMLWIYWENDLYWGADNPRRWAAAFREGGGRVQFHQLPPTGQDGHLGLSSDMDRWVPLVERYLAEAGFDRPGLVPRPPPSGYAAIDAIDKVPLSPTVRDTFYRRFLAATPPRAFAVGPNGAAGWAEGDWALGRALGLCQSRTGVPCRFYAIDDDVVWAPESLPAPPPMDPASTLGSTAHAPLPPLAVAR